MREGKIILASVQPVLVESRDPLTEAKKNQFQIGAMFLPIPAPPTQVIVKGDGVFETVGLGVSKTVALTRSMLASFYHLAVGDISPKTLGGPILIGKIAGESFKAGASQFFRMMAFISMNLAILNLLPVPVLDGGHLVMFAVEGIRRRPLSIKFIEAWSTVGFVFLMGLVAVVFFNDLSRLGLFRFLQ
jgi:regulator of sigma E protease